MKSHLQYLGKPWCNRPSSKEVVEIELNAPRGMALSCQGTHAQNIKAVGYLRSMGLDVTLVEGSCNADNWP